MKISRKQKDNSITNYNNIKINIQHTLEDEFSLIVENLNNNKKYTPLSKNEKITISSWITQMDIPFGNTIYNEDVTITFDGIIFYDSDLNRLVTFLYFEDFKYEEISFMHKMGYSELFFNGKKERIIFGLEKKDINYRLSKSIILCKNIDGVEIQKYIKDIETSYFIDIVKIIEIDEHSLWSEEIDFGYKKENYKESYYNKNNYFEEFLSMVPLKKSFYLTLEIIKSTLYGNIKIKSAINIKKLNSYFKSMAKLGCEAIKLNNINIELREDPDDFYLEEYLHNFLPEEISKDMACLMRGEINKSSIITFKDLIKLIKNHLPNIENLQIQDFIYFKLDINSIQSEIQHLNINYTHDHYMHFELYLEDEKITLESTNHKAEILPRMTHNEIENLLDSEIFPIFRKKLIKTFYRNDIDDEDLPF